MQQSIELLSNERAYDLVWEHFAVTMEARGKNPLAEAFGAYDWYVQGSMASTPDLDMWAENVRTLQAQHNAKFTAEIIKNEQQRLQSSSHQLMNLNNHREIIDREISDLISKNGGVDVIYQHFVKTMTEKGNNPLAFAYNQIMWYVSHMRINQ